MSAPIITREVAAAAVDRVWAQMFPEEVAADVAGIVEFKKRAHKISDRELARETYWLEFSRARKAGFDEKKANEIAAAEVRLVLRRPPAADHSGPSRSRPDRQLPAGGHIVYDPLRDVFARIGDADDKTPYASPCQPLRESEHARFARAEKAFAEHVAEETGEPAGDDVKWFESKAEREETLRQSHVIGNKLECGGTQAYRADEYQLKIVSVHTGHVEAVPMFRQICFIPYVAARVRAPKLAALEYFISCHTHSRFWTFTSGTRVPMSGLRARIEELHLRLNKLNKELRRRYGVEIVFRSTELGTVETAATAGQARARRAAKKAHSLAVAEAKANGRPVPVWTRAKDSQFADDAGRLDRDELTGELFFHPHAHCVLHMRRTLPKERWSEMLSFVWAFWGHHWDDGKIIRDAREACKYVTKSGEMSLLPSAELCALEKALHGLRLVTPMGVLKKEIRARKDAGLRLRSQLAPDGSGRVWNVVEDHNRQLSSSEAEKAGRRDAKRQARLDYIDGKNRIYDPRTGELVSAGMGHTGAFPRKSTAHFCNVVSRMSPAAVASPLKEPRVMVMHSRGGFDMSRVKAHPLFIGMWQCSVEAWHAGRAIRVHESTSTGEQRLLTLLAETDERYAPDSGAVWEASKPCVPAYLD